MERSARSIPTGPGSRGGRWGHHPPPEYWREWRRRHPDYMDRERQRMMFKRAFARAVRIIQG